MYDENDPWSDEDSEASGSEEEDSSSPMTISIKKNLLVRNSKK